MFHESGLGRFVDHPLGEIKNVFSRQQIKLHPGFTVYSFIQGLESTCLEYLLEKIATVVKVLMQGQEKLT